MVKQYKASEFSFIWNFLCVVVPLCIVVYGAYFIYLNMSVRNNTLKTYADVTFIVRNIHDAYINEKYKNFDTQTLVADNFLPFDAKVERQNNIFIIKNRFGGELFATEGMQNEEERVLFLAQEYNRDYYKQIYKGVGAFILIFSKLNKYACKEIVQQNWDKINGFMGMEISSVWNEPAYNNAYNLNIYVLNDNFAETFVSKDKGVVSRVPLNRQQAREVCVCRADECSLSLKFR